MKYSYERMSDGRYQVRLAGEFVCYVTEPDDDIVDYFLDKNGFSSRIDFFNYCINNI